jgi:hypothetical protein
MPEEVRNLCRLADIPQVLASAGGSPGYPGENDRPHREADHLGRATRETARKETAKPKAGRPKHYVFAYRPTTKAFNLKLSFAKSRATRDEVIDALEAILRELRKAK